MEVLCDLFYALPNLPTIVNLIVFQFKHVCNVVVLIQLPVDLSVPHKSFSLLM